ncbi:MAG: DUF3829 domain-containing protein [Ignavibacteria bacterium]|nr:YiiG family protein [Ignavibacteria bacterium]MCC7159785.1 DUF3829 domain-containing protein [Ignavibacteria bacterium]
MRLTKLISLFVLIFFLVTSCSTIDKLKEKISSDKNGDTKEDTKKEETKEVTSTDDLAFYNKYIDVSNKIQEAGEKVQKDYYNDIPDPKSISKSSFIMAVSMGLSVDNLERVTKEYRRSYFDGGELSKLNAGSEMKNEIEGNLKTLLTEMETYHKVAAKVANYYKKGEYKTDLSSAEPYDAEIKSAYDKYKSAFDSFSASIKKYKPKRNIRDPNSISNPDERSVAILMNAYENTLDKAEEFYEAFNSVEYKGDLSKAKGKFNEFELSFKEDKNTVLSGEFSEKTKYMKYSYEDYFVKMTSMFLDAGNKFFDTAPDAKDVNSFNRAYDDVVNNYNYMITAYNSNINIVNTFRVY